MLTNRIRIIVVGSCWSYKLQLDASESLVEATNENTSTNYFDVPPNSTAFVLDFRLQCGTASVQSLSVRYIPQRWIGPSRVFVSDKPLLGSSTLRVFDAECAQQGPPSLGTWTAFLWGNFSTRFPSNQLVFPLAHRTETGTISVGNLSIRDAQYAASKVAYDSDGKLVTSTNSIWINDGDNDCTGWEDPTALGSRVSLANTTNEGWRQAQGTDSCSTANLFYCVEVFTENPREPCKIGRAHV